MAIVVLPNVDSKFATGQPAYGTDITGNVNTLLNDYNGNITNDNLSASAAIADSRLAQISTAGKVATTALPLTLTSATTGFTIAGGTSSKTLTVSGDATISGTPLTVQVGFGAWVDKSADYGAQAAATDGFVVAYGAPDAGANGAIGYTDTNANPTTVRVKIGTSSAAVYGSMTMPVKKGHYWKMVVTGSVGDFKVWWIPLGA